MAYLTKVVIGGVTIKDDSDGSDPNRLLVGNMISEARIKFLS